MKIELIDHCTSDLDVVNAARVSFAQQSDWVWDPAPAKPLHDSFESATHGVGSFVSDASLRHLQERDAGLIRFLMRERHGTPFEHGFLKFHVEAPIFVFREWHRHRVGHSYNEMSGRYVELERRFYQPDSWRVQEGKPGAYTYREMDPAEWDHQSEADAILEHAYQEAWGAYQDLLHLGVAKEQARAVLPVGIYSQMIWSCNPRSLMHFCGLRCAPTAMQEIRTLADSALDALRFTMPVTAEAFEANGYRAP